eukprot:6210039-Pleurochrysis_carterae.AAC.1
MTQRCKGAEVKGLPASPGGVPRCEECVTLCFRAGSAAKRARIAWQDLAVPTRVRAGCAFSGGGKAIAALRDRKHGANGSQIGEGRHVVHGGSLAAANAALNRARSRKVGDEEQLEVDARTSAVG